MFKIVRSVGMLVFTITKWPTCVYILFVPNGTGHMFIDLGFVVHWLCESKGSLQPISRWITVPRVARLEAKCESLRSNFLKVYRRDLKMEEKIQTILLLDDFVLLLRNNLKRK